MSLSSDRENDVIYKSESLCVRFVDRSSATTCVVTFSSLGYQQPLVREGFGENVIASLGYDGYHVTCADNNWYQYADTKDILKVLKEKTSRYTNVVTYGSSMGGYAALLFGPRLAAKRIIAISPQVSIDPKRVPFETRWADQAVKMSFIDDDVLSGLSKENTIYVLYDPHDMDAKHVRMLERTDAIIVCLPIPFAGHGSANVLREAGHLRQAMITLITAQYDRSEWSQMRRSCRRNSATYWLGLCLWFLERRNHRQAVYAGHLARSLNGQDVRLLSILAVALRRNGSWKQAVEIFEEIFRIDPSQQEKMKIQYQESVAKAVEKDES